MKTNKINQDWVTHQNNMRTNPEYKAQYEAQAAHKEDVEAAAFQLEGTITLMQSLVSGRTEAIESVNSEALYAFLDLMAHTTRRALGQYL